MKPVAIRAMIVGMPDVVEFCFDNVGMGDESH